MPFDDIRRLMADLPEADADAVGACRAREAQLTKPPGALGRLEAISEWLSAWQGIIRRGPSAWWWPSSPATMVSSPRALPPIRRK